MRLSWITFYLIAPLYRKTFCRIGQHWLQELSGKTFSNTDFLLDHPCTYAGDLRYSCDPSVHRRCKRDEKEIKDGKTLAAIPAGNGSEATL